MGYTLNTDSAKKAGTSSRIDMTGAYVGQIKVAWEIQSSKGTDGVEMMFEDIEGRSADFLQVWTRNRDGKELMGMSVVNAIMACCELKSLTTEERPVTRMEETKKVPVLKELTGKRVGLMLEREPYTKNDGTLGFRMVIVCPFEADTKRTAKEKLERAEKPEAYARLLANLKDRPLQKPQGTTTSQPAAATANAGPDDDIPW